jgi:hypothetical protein
MEEVEGKAHWWWDTKVPNDGGVLNDGTMREFYASCLHTHQDSRVENGSTTASKKTLDRTYKQGSIYDNTNDIDVNHKDNEANKDAKNKIDNEDSNDKNSNFENNHKNGLIDKNIDENRKKGDNRCLFSNFTLSVINPGSQTGMFFHSLFSADSYTIF